MKSRGGVISNVMAVDIFSKFNLPNLTYHAEMTMLPQAQIKTLTSSIKNVLLLQIS